MNLRKLTPLMLLSATCLLSSSLAMAQVERLPGVVDRDLPTDELPEGYGLNEEQRNPLEAEPKLEAVEKPEEVIATLKTVDFKGVSVLDQAVLDGIVAPYKGKSFTRGDLAQLKYELRKAFYDLGFILVRVTTPVQDLSSGNLVFEIYEAKVGKVNIEANGRINESLVESFAGQIKAGTVFQESNVESMISDINDLPNVRAKVVLRPGDEFLTTDLNVLIERAKEDTQRLFLDNYGSELTGSNVATVQLEKSNLLKFGEKIRLTARASNEDLYSVGGSIKTPLGYKNYFGELNYLHSENDIGDRLAALNAEGETDILGIAVSRKILNTRRNQIEVKAGFEARTHESLLSGVRDTKDDIRQAYINATYLNRQRSSVAYGALRISRGLDVLGASDEGDAGNTRNAGNPDAWIIEPTVIYNRRPWNDGLIKFLATGQLASHALLSSDLFTLGGYGSVRGFEPAQETGEAGFAFNLEYNHNVFDDLHHSIALGPFLDAGRIYNRVVNSKEDNTLASTGIGIEYRTDISTVGDTVVRFDWAYPLGGYTSNEVDGSTFYLRLGQNF